MLALTILVLLTRFERFGNPRTQSATACLKTIRFTISSWQVAIGRTSKTKTAKVDLLSAAYTSTLKVSLNKRYHSETDARSSCKERFAPSLSTDLSTKRLHKIYLDARSDEMFEIGKNLEANGQKAPRKVEIMQSPDRSKIQKTTLRSTFVEKITGPARPLK